MDRFLTADDLAAALRRDVRDGLTARPKTLPPKYFYDERGSALFEKITELPEYYPTRREREIIVDRAREIAVETAATTLLELGAGSGEKTRVLLDALAGSLRTYVPVDVSGDFLADAAAKIAADHGRLEVRPVVADYERHLALLPTGGRRLVVFLGGTIGNMPRAARLEFLTGLRATMGPGDALLLGADLVKDTARLVRAYDDAAGVTAEFNRNVLRVIDRELGADFDPDAFAHVARWNEDEEQIEMWLRSERDQVVRIPALDLTVRFARGEEMRTEISAKFRPAVLEEEMDAAGLAVAEFWTDAAGDFSLTLARPV
ncbi:L-histidine N(alpha)-methyltransferase [Actinomadura atramentaria]|uniref:L-histidine N(alpha)-methyltransferase n=1 Tax=Actinomadura atramentaria TaxID=1990 RepID=UPI000374CD8D|nr:L-histidine N(alpha)-methyltransferase [Actinomadura atramentaria]